MNKTQSFKFTRKDFQWVIALFGTAVGAGVLFLPIRAGMSGFFSVIVMSIIIFPTIWLGHRALGYFVLSSKSAGSDITEAMKDHLGGRFGRFVSVLYFFFLWPVCMAYSVGLTNTVASFMINQLHINISMTHLGFRSIISFISITLVVFVLVRGRETVLKVTNVLVYPLIVILLLFSLYLVPSWNIQNVRMMPTWKDFFANLWLTLPVLVFAFNHSPAISPMVQDLNTEDSSRDIIQKKVNSIELQTTNILVLFIMFFVVSCVLFLTPDQLQEARMENIPILSYFANKTGSTFIGFIGPLVAFAAIGSSFFTHLLGCVEALRGSMIDRVTNKTPQQMKKINAYIVFALYISMILMSILNPNILDFMESLGGPIIALIIFVMPIYAFYTVPALEKYRKNVLANIWVLVMGLLTVGSVIFKLFGG